MRLRAGQKWCMGRSESMSDRINIEVVFALAGEQALIALAVDEGATVADAIAKSGLQERFADAALDTMQTGIWGRPVDRHCRVKDGDRVEIYRPLQRDPRDARRILAQSGMTMSGSSDD